MFLNFWIFEIFEKIWNFLKFLKNLKFLTFLKISHFWKIWNFWNFENFEKFENFEIFEILSIFVTQFSEVEIPTLTISENAPSNPKFDALSEFEIQNGGRARLFCKTKNFRIRRISGELGI